MTHPLGRFVRARRTELKMTQVALAAALGIERNFLCRWEAGDRPVPDPWLPRLAAALGVPEAHLQSLQLPATKRTRLVHAGYAPLEPVNCTVEEMVNGTTSGRRLISAVREKLGAALYDELRHALLRDTRWELLAAHALLTDTARLAWLTPLEEGCTRLIVAEDRRTYQGHLLRLSVVWERDDERMVFLPQIPIGVPEADERFRVDFLVLSTRRGKRLPPVAVELDGASAHRHHATQDTRRSRLLQMPVARFDNSATEDPYFLSALHDAVSEKAEYARVSEEAYESFTADRRQRVEKAVQSGLLRS